MAYLGGSVHDANWSNWCYQTQTTTSATSMVWVNWNGTNTGNTMATSTTTTGTATAWYMWCDQHGNIAAAQPRQYTVEEIEANEARMAEQRKHWAEIAEKERKAKEEAEARAEKLLIENLSLKQREQYQRDKHFVIERGDRRYRVRRGRSGNVDVIGRDGRVTHRLCAHPAEGVPDCDTMLAQKLLLENDEEHFMRLANRHLATEGPAVLPALN